MGLTPTTTDSGKEEFGMTMPRPPVPELLDHFLGNGDVARLAAFALRNQQASCFGIDVRDLHVESFGEAQAASVDERKAGVETRFGDV